MVAIKKHHPEPDDVDDIPGVQILDAEEGRSLFDYKARQLLNVSGEEFVRRWDAGDFRPVPDTVEGRKVGRLVMMIPFARPTNA